VNARRRFPGAGWFVDEGIRLGGTGVDTADARLGIITPGKVRLLGRPTTR